MLYLFSSYWSTVTFWRNIIMKIKNVAQVLDIEQIERKKLSYHNNIIEIPFLSFYSVVISVDRNTKKYMNFNFFLEYFQFPAEVLTPKAAVCCWFWIFILENVTKKHLWYGGLSFDMFTSILYIPCISAHYNWRLEGRKRSRVMNHDVQDEAGEIKEADRHGQDLSRLGLWRVVHRSWSNSSFLIILMRSRLQNK